jgi:hypothetical protein
MHPFAFGKLTIESPIFGDINIVAKLESALRRKLGLDE